jgi:hypothetical protein
MIQPDFTLILFQSFYRLVGALERKTGHFQCFTIRQAQANEQRLAKQQVEVCSNVMTKLISMIAEA